MCVIYAQNFHLTPWKKYTASKWRTVFAPLILIFLLPCFDITDKKGCLFSYIGTPQIFTLDSPDWSQLVHCHQRIVRWASCQIIVHFRWRYNVFRTYYLPMDLVNHLPKPREIQQNVSIIMKLRLTLSSSLTSVSKSVRNFNQRCRGKPSTRG